MLRAVEAINSLVESEARLAKAQSIARLDYWRWDILNKDMIISEQLAARLQLDTNQDITAQLIPRIADVDRSRIIQIVQHAIDPETIPVDFEVILNSTDDSRAHKIFRVQSELEYDNLDRLVAIEGTLQDITDRKETEARIQYLSRFDHLTGLQNRESFTRVLHGLINECVRRDGCISLVLIDIDRFVGINDLFGHRTGNAVIIEVSRRINTFIDNLNQEHSDISCEVSRWGGDKFSLAIGGSSDSSYTEVITSIHDYISVPFKVNGHEVSLTACIGYANGVDSNLDLGTLLRHAENAMRNAKRQGRNIIRCYDKSMQETTARRMLLEVELHKALPAKQFRLVYQPRIKADDNSIAGAEALLRWQHPQMGDISPDEFIPVLEEMGAIHEVGALVMEIACQQLKSWHDAGYSNFVMSVNVSAVQFRDMRLAEEIEEVIKRTGIRPEFLEVELTETAIMEDVSQTQAILTVLKKLGVRISVDDFGTGYSSLGYLRSFPLDTLKIDRTFVTELPGNSEDRSLTSAIIAMARSLHLHVVAEGIETQAQADFLLEQNCDEFQGFLFSRPIDYQSFNILLEKGKIAG